MFLWLKKKFSSVIFFNNASHQHFCSVIILTCTLQKELQSLSNLIQQVAVISFPKRFGQYVRQHSVIDILCLLNRKSVMQALNV